MLANSRQGDRAFLHTAEDEASGRAVWKLVESAPIPILAKKQVFVSKAEAQMQSISPTVMAMGHRNDVEVLGLGDSEGPVFRMVGADDCPTRV